MVRMMKDIYRPDTTDHCCMAQLEGSLGAKIDRSNPIGVMSRRRLGSTVWQSLLGYRPIPINVQWDLYTVPFLNLCLIRNPGSSLTAVGQRRRVPQQVRIIHSSLMISNDSQPPVAATRNCNCCRSGSISGACHFFPVGARG